MPTAAKPQPRQIVIPIPSGRGIFRGVQRTAVFGGLTAAIIGGVLGLEIFGLAEVNHDEFTVIAGLVTTAIGALFREILDTRR